MIDSSCPSCEVTGETGGRGGRVYLGLTKLRVARNDTRLVSCLTWQFQFEKRKVVGLQRR
jgi:hypothetical protein